MLWTSPRNFKEIDTFKTIKENIEPNKFDPSLRVDLKVESNIVFTVDNVLSHEECDYYIQQTNIKGYQDLTQQFEKDYRGSQTYLLLLLFVYNLQFFFFLFLPEF